MADLLCHTCGIGYPEMCRPHTYGDGELSFSVCEPCNQALLRASLRLLKRLSPTLRAARQEAEQRFAQLEATAKAAQEDYHAAQQRLRELFEREVERIS
jgi:hypothetical protein